eukprot:scaffold43515_cov18-Tisochrysis_lutea.AAC.1
MHQRHTSAQCTGDASCPSPLPILLGLNQAGHALESPSPQNTWVRSVDPAPHCTGKVKWLSYPLAVHSTLSLRQILHSLLQLDLKLRLSGELESSAGAYRISSARLPLEPGLSHCTAENMLNKPVPSCANSWTWNGRAKSSKSWH